MLVLVLALRVAPSAGGQVGQDGLGARGKKEQVLAEPLVLKRLQLDVPIELEGGGGEEEGEEPEPPDEDPGWEPDPEDPDADPLPELDSEDEPDEDDELVTLTDAVPAGMQVAAPPEAELLEYKSAAGVALVGRSIIFNWVGVGWCAGTIESAEKMAFRGPPARALRLTGPCPARRARWRGRCDAAWQGCCCMLAAQLP